MADNAPLILLLVVLLVAAAYLGAAEAAMIRVRASAVEVLVADGDRRARLLGRLVDDLPRVLNTVLLSVLLVQIGAATVTGLLAERWFGNLGITLTSIALTLVMFVYAEAIPKTYALRNPLRVAKSTAPLLRVLTIVLRPVVSVLIGFADFQAPGQGIAGTAGVTEDELRRLAAEAVRAGEIAHSDHLLMERSFRLGDQRVDEILVPRIDVVSVSAATSVREALDVALRAGHRRLPVHEGAADNITGLVRLRDLAGAVAAGRDDNVESLSRPVLIVPESKRVFALLREMQRTNCHFAVAVDEHGGMAGILTIEDVVEELVGNVADEGESRRPLIEETAPGRWRVDARLSVTSLEDELSVGLPRGDWNTVGGLVIGLAGRIPGIGDSVTAGALEATVTSGTRRRIREVEIRRN